MKTKKGNKKGKNTFKTVNGIQKTPYGTYRVRKTINGVTYGKSFKTFTDASKYLSNFK